MPYNKEVDARIERISSGWKDIARKNMFGGVCYLQKGNMFCGVYKDFLILRLGEEGAKRALGLLYVKPFDITGKPMKGWVMVGQEGFQSDEDLERWLTEARDFAAQLPSK